MRKATTGEAELDTSDARHSAYQLTLVTVGRRKFLIGAGAVFGATAFPSLLAACTTGGDQEQDQEQSVRTLTVAYPDVPGVLDSDQSETQLAEEVAENIHGGDVLRYKLVQDENGLWIQDLGAERFDGIENGLAESWEASEDLKTYTMRLRQDLVSVFGNPLIADDVVWSWQKRYGVEGTGASRTFGVAGGVTDANQVTKIDDHTVRFELPASNNLFPKVNAIFTVGGLYDSTEAKKHATEADPFALEYLAETGGGGFGAYAVESLAEGREIVFRSNKNYFRGEPHFERVTWRGVPKSSERLAMLVRGDVDIATALSARELEQVRNTNNLAVTSFVANRQMHMRLNNKEKPFDDVRVRQALAYAMPVDQIIESVYNGKARPVKSQLSELVAGYTDEYWVYSRNVDKAKSLLAEAGAEGLSFEIIYDLAIPELEPAGVIIQTAFAEVGVQVELQGLPAANYGERRNKRDFQGALGENYPYLPDPAYTVQLFFVSDHPANWANYNNPEYDKIAKALPTMRPGAEYDRMVLRAQEIWERDQPWIMICNPGFHIAHRENLTGFVWGGSNTLRFEKLANA